MSITVELYHNIRWARYKARVFSALHHLTADSCTNVRITQIADTSGERKSLSGVELVYHQYPHDLMFPGTYEEVPVWKLVTTLFVRVFRSDADLVLIPGYDRPEYWAMLLAAAITRKARGVFCDSTLNDRIQTPLKGMLKRVFFSSCDVFFGYGTRSKEMLLHYGANPARIFYRVQAAALPDSYNLEDARASRIMRAPPGDAPRFLYVGRLSPEKGLDTLLLALHNLRRYKPAAMLELVGSGPQEEALKKQAIALGLDQSVVFTGSLGQDALGEVYSRATCLVLPSRSEPWGLVVNEALHYGCPVIVSDRCGCVPELVVDGVTGFAFKTDDVDDLAQKMMTVATQFTDPGLVADRCLKLISKYTPEAAAKQILAGCRFVLANKNPQP